MIYILMGVSGSGKTTIGRLLASRLQLPFLDADDYHPAENIRKMSEGIPLSDTDRMPWLKLLSETLTSYRHGGVVLACSALKEMYRKNLVDDEEVGVCWVFLHGDFEAIYERLKARKGHFMTQELLQSQFDTLEPPVYGLHLDIADEPDKLVDHILAKYS